MILIIAGINYIFNSAEKGMNAFWDIYDIIQKFWEIWECCAFNFDAHPVHSGAFMLNFKHI